MEPLKLRTLCLRNPGTKVQATITFAIADSDVDYETTFMEYAGHQLTQSSSACCIRIGPQEIDLVVLLNANDICPAVIHHEFAHIQQWYTDVVHATYDHTPETEEHVAATLGRIGAIVNWWYVDTGAMDASYFGPEELRDFDTVVQSQFEPEDFVDPEGNVPESIPPQHVGYATQTPRNQDHVESK